MRTFRRAVLLGLLLLASTEAPADAAGLITFLDILDHLSGPGPFWGYGVGANLLCVTDSGELTRKCFIQTGRVGVSNAERVTPRLEVGPHAVVFGGQINDSLTYAPGTSNDAKRVNAIAWGGHGVVWLRQQPSGSKAPFFGATLRYTVVHFRGDLVRGRTLTSAMVGVGPVVSFRFASGNRLEIAPLAQLGLGPFNAADFGVLDRTLGSDAIKLNVHVGFMF